MLLSRHKRPGAYARRASSVKKTIKNQFVWRRHCLTLSLGKPILFPKKGDCQGVLRSRRRETSRCIGCSSVGAAVREWPRQAGRLAAGAGVTLGAPLMAVGRPSSHGEDFNYKSTVGGGRADLRIGGRSSDLLIANQMPTAPSPSKSSLSMTLLPRCYR